MMARGRWWSGLVLLAAMMAAPAQAAVKIEVMANGLDHPWSVAFLPDGRVLVTERKGQLRVIGRDGRLGTVTGVPAVFHESQAGLFDVVLHPRFADNQTLYLSYAKGSFKANATVIVRARLSKPCRREAPSAMPMSAPSWPAWRWKRLWVSAIHAGSAGASGPRSAPATPPSGWTV
jgi:glucose/arabinose dehydrogenase